MTEAELMSSIHGYQAGIDTIFFGYVSVLSGFLIMSYFAANKLATSLSAIVLALFTVVCGVLITRLSYMRNDFEALYTYIVQQQASGNLDIPWFGTNPSFGAELISYLIYFVTVGGYLGCIAFFFFQRRSA